ncbi:MAG TPA: FAD/NAD(P)-binding oxidoreductase [Anaerolineales bacterium]
MAQVLILGGGFGGVAAGVELRKLLSPSDRITLVDRREQFYFGFRKTWALLGETTVAAGQRPLKSLERLGITVRHGTVDAIDPEAKAALIDGARVEADALVVALGAQSHPDGVPGFREHGLNLYDGPGLATAAERLRQFSGGRVAVVILGIPYPCPPAPFELALLLVEYFDRKGIEAVVDVFTPQPMSLPVLGQTGCAVVESRLEASHVGFHPNHTPISIESSAIHFKTARVAFDLMIGVPGHLCPSVARVSGLAGDGEWVKVDPRTLAASYSGVYALGDMVSIPLANGKRLPQAGVFAEAQAKVVAARIAAELAGQVSQATYDGTGFCFLEVGGGAAMLVQGNFLAAPEPEVRILEPAPEHLQAKRELERSRLADWFGE